MEHSQLSQETALPSSSSQGHRQDDNDIMAPSRPISDRELVLLSCNVKGSTVRLRALAKAMQGIPRPPDIVALQDAPKEFPFLIGASKYFFWYNTNRPVLMEDNPDFKGPRSSNYEELEKLEIDPVGFLIHTSISRAWSVQQYSNSNQALVASLKLQTELGQMCIHNIHNRKCEIKIDELSSTCLKGDDLDVFLGDTNLHASIWTGEPSGQELKAVELADSLLGAGMHCIMTPGVLTYARGLFVSKENCSTIDVIFVGHALRDRVSESHVVEDWQAFDSDHRPLMCTLSLQPSREPGRRRRWDKLSED
ncbi:hypothetical protein BS50DRAFT_629541 [Corynespora cassiicola Philippines]|uniref:Endonuclease/exonuclease/phosphatase domain-containing protein n=1 Tax=Corynespora cassiicola Philippines TaxID=1448308 RepID=A0A2T2P751_CORCC|nr:hypothetical protein BS50DRAFT_629541 [Corynespora cassiicola Philippines]